MNIITIFHSEMDTCNVQEVFVLFMDYSEIENVPHCSRSFCYSFWKPIPFSLPRFVLRVVRIPFSGTLDEFKIPVRLYITLMRGKILIFSLQRFDRLLESP